MSGPLLAAYPVRPARESPPPGFFEHPEYLAVRAHLPAPWQDILDLAYYSGWRKNEILGLTWDEIDEAGGVIRLSPARSKTLVGRILPISHPIAGGSGVSVLWRTCGTSQRPNNGATRVCYCAGIRPFCCQLRLMPGAR